MSIISRMQSQIGGLSASQRKAADYMLKNLNDTMFLTVDQLANVAGTSTGTIMRMAVNLGFEGYSQMQKSIQAEMMSQITPSGKLRINAASSENQDLVAQAAEVQVKNIMDTASYLSGPLLDECCELLMNARRIYVCGIRTSYAAAHYIYFGLNRITGKCEMLTPGPGDLPEKLLDILEKDVLISVSLPRYTNLVLDVTRFASSRGTKIIAITDGYQSPLADYSSILIPCEYMSNSFVSSPMGVMFVGECLLSAMAMKNPDSSYGNLDNLENILKSFDYHVQQKQPEAKN